MNEEHKVPYGMKGESIVHISEVDSGLACGCVCPVCGGKLVAKKGHVYDHHFAHYATSCSYSLETALHYLAKEILLEAKEMWIPPTILYSQTHYIVHQTESQLIKFDDVVLEQRREGFIPDLLVIVKGRPLFLEVCVTHKVSTSKKKKVRELGISMLEIKLEDKQRLEDYASIKKVLVDEITNKKWVYNAKIEELKKLYIGSYTEKQEPRIKKRKDGFVTSSGHWFQF